MAPENTAVSGSDIELSVQSRNAATNIDPGTRASKGSSIGRLESTQWPSQAGLKLVSSGFSFFCAGVNDGSLGTLIPYLLPAYDIDTGLVAIMYVAVSFLRIYSIHVFEWLMVDYA